MKLVPAVGYGKWRQVIEIQQKLDAISGEQENSYYTYADAYYHLNELTKAQHFAQKALAENEDDFRVLKILTEIYFKKNNHGKAKEYARRALANSHNLSFDRTDSFFVLLLKLFSIIPKIRKGRRRFEKSISNIEIRKNRWIL